MCRGGERRRLRVEPCLQEDHCKEEVTLEEGVSLKEEDACEEGIAIEEEVLLKEEIAFEEEIVRRIARKKKFICQGV